MGRGAGQGEQAVHLIPYGSVERPGARQEPMQRPSRVGFIGKEWPGTRRLDAGPQLMESSPPV